MSSWSRPVRRLRSLLSKPAPEPRAVPLAGGEAAGSLSHLQSLLASRPFEAPRNGRILLAESGTVALAVEEGMMVPGGAVAMRGWLTDPHSQIAALWLEIDGAFRPASLASLAYRSDVIGQRGLTEAFPDLRTGWSLFEVCELKPSREAVVALHAITQRREGFVVLSSGMKLAPGQRCSLERLTSEFRAGSAGAPAIAAAAEPFLRGLASIGRHTAWRERRLEATSGRPADISVVIVVNENADMLHHSLAALEACRHARNIEVVLALRTSEIDAAVTRCLLDWRGTSPFAGIKTLVPFGQVGFGQAARGGIGFSQGQAIAVASDEILPPNGNWVGPALEMLSQDPTSVLVPSVATFDHRPFTLAGAFDVAWGEFEHDHSALRDLGAVEGVRKATAWSAGFLIARRDLLESAAGLDDSLSETDICLLDFVLRLQFDAAACLKTLPGAFTHLRLPAYTAGDAVERLWSLYALAASIRRLYGAADPCGSAERASSAIRPEPRPAPA